MKENVNSNLSSLEEEEFSGDSDPNLGVNLNSDDNMLAPEDIANDAFRRIFREVPNFEIGEERRSFVNHEGEAATGHVCVKSFICKLSGGKQQLASRSEQCSPKRHKSPTSRHTPSIHSPFAKRRLLLWESLNSVRKTKSSALPTMPKTKWKSRGVTASTPDLKMEDRNFEEGLNPENNERVYSRNGNGNSYRILIVYNNLQLCNIILNCIIVAVGLIIISCATAVAFNKEIFLMILNHHVYVLILFSLFSVSTILLILAGLSITHQSSRKTIAHGVAALFMAVILISLAIVENAVETKILFDVESQMLSTIQYKPIIWDYLHEKLKCCGVRGYLDWCTKANFDSTENMREKNFLGSLVCTPPISCCVDYKSDAEVNYKYQRQDLCLQTPTPWNSYQNGCISPIKSEMYFLGKIYRITNFGLAITLMLSATLSVIQFTLF
ncbi:uncharacterized protein LOC117169442 isoform X2 [Belonocnema kinseyi]|uniref:uncharacterized protein LOC117169442 isoform X2 n=1 Tax=Belonocnema kinseyi TaxID=2817044 RepID=UPI00143DC6BE|nr:uncharacterized protein LOC117169442 isoform X2 [Belonocnema kinseyi]